MLAGDDDVSRVVDFLVKARLCAGARILELACGSCCGPSIRSSGVASDGGIFGVDVCDADVERALLTKAYRDCHQVASLTVQLPFANAVFDAVICSDLSVARVDDFSACLSEACRVAKQGALVCWLQPSEEWKDETGGCATAAAALEEAKRWRRVRVDEGARALVAFRRMRIEADEEERERQALERARRQREESLAARQAVKAEAMRQRQAEEERKRWERECEAFQRGQDDAAYATEVLTSAADDDSGAKAVRLDGVPGASAATLYHDLVSDVSSDEGG